MEDPPRGSWGRWIPELKSILALFIGLFCVLCFKNLIVFGRRWKNIIINWGYRSLNVPSLWIADALSHGTSSNRDSGPPVHLGLNAESAKKQFRRVPALRLPDAWPNFLITWLYLNLSTMFSLVPAWVAAINEELTKATTQSTRVSGHIAPRSKGYRLELQSVLSESMPPRLSAIETSASGSTKELHFRCTFSSPCVSLQTELTVPGQNPSTDDPRRTTHVLRLQNNACRVQLICAALEGGYVLLSWKLISPLIVNNLELLTPGLKVEAKLCPTDVRWIKDTLYEAIQSAIPRLILSPFCVTPVQKLTADRTVKSMSNWRSDSSQSSSYLLGSGLTHPPGCRCHIRSDQVTTGSVQIRLLSAILLEPSEPDWLALLRPCAWRCQLRSNASLGPGSDPSIQTDQTAILAVTPAAYLQSRSWPTEIPHSGKSIYPNVLQPLDTSSATYVVVWNFDVCVSTKELNSDLLDVLLYTESDSENGAASHLSGHAVLPLAPSGECHAHNQHVVLVDCHFGTSDTQGTAFPDGVAHPRQSPGPTCQPSVKFMLTLRVETFPMGYSGTDESADGHRSSRSPDWFGGNSTSTTRPSSQTVSPNEATFSQKSTVPISCAITPQSSEPSAVPLTAEQVIEFMSKPASTFEQNGSLSIFRRQRSRSVGNGTSNAKESPSLRAGEKRPGWIASTAQKGSGQREPPGSPAAIHGPIMSPQYSASFRAARVDQSFWPDDPPSPPMRGGAATPGAPLTVMTTPMIGITPTPPKKHRRFFRFRSNTTSREPISSREQFNSEPITNGVSNFVEGFIEPSVDTRSENKNNSSTRRQHIGSRLQRLFRRSVNRRRKSFDHVTRSQSLDRRLVNSGIDSYSIH
ncbi:hypothetical protein D915_000681 [Fasciola hepatica]|uniref:Uncharacterized protein n=1 Tax=Fasciola hepatica TaxID=6192 RepID=A0A4E0RLZ6_FASHE|nr:hypothetical protein D915_000681 [Fasciola hepatica]